MRTAKLVLPASSNNSAAAIENHILILSREMVRVHLAGKSDYVVTAEKAKQADQMAKTIAQMAKANALRRGFAGQHRYKKLPKSFFAQQETVDDLVIRRSVLYKVMMAGQEPALNLMLEPHDMKTIPDNKGPECTEYVCFHELKKTDVAAAVCILATQPLQQHSALWNRRGKAAMAVINEQNNLASKTQSGFRLSTLIIDDWGLAAEGSTRCSFLQGMDSMFHPDISLQHVEAISPPCSRLHSPRDPRVPP